MGTFKRRALYSILPILSMRNLLAESASPASDDRLEFFSAQRLH
jgi:hypothetical protein